MPSMTNKILGKVIRKIPLFKGLSPSQIQKVLNLCATCTFQPGEIVCEEGAQSDEIYILISGELAVVTKDGIPLATIATVTTVGEMGVMTREVRSATVRAVQPSRILIIQKNQLAYLMRADRDIQVHIYQNIIHILATRVRRSNEQRVSNLAEIPAGDGPPPEPVYK